MIRGVRGLPHLDDCSRRHCDIDKGCCSEIGDQQSRRRINGRWRSVDLLGLARLVSIAWILQQMRSLDFFLFVLPDCLLILAHCIPSLSNKSRELLLRVTVGKEVRDLTVVSG